MPISKAPKTMKLLPQRDRRKSTSRETHGFSDIDEEDEIADSGSSSKCSAQYTDVIMLIFIIVSVPSIVSRVPLPSISRRRNCGENHSTDVGCVARRCHGISDQWCHRIGRIADGQSHGDEPQRWKLHHFSGLSTTTTAKSTTTTAMLTTTTTQSTTTTAMSTTRRGRVPRSSSLPPRQRSEKGRPEPMFHAPHDFTDKVKAIRRDTMRKCSDALRMLISETEARNSWKRPHGSDLAIFIRTIAGNNTDPAAKASSTQKLPNRRCHHTMHLSNFFRTSSIIKQATWACKSTSVLFISTICNVGRDCCCGLG
ncbi:hypothetical protein F5Y18DRAFT_177153 [Xylariaceae sp. FL1019]|nr:hypothetical protein F5Y18DRAFT_177153 [Xylariaceae sp. FL1019]